MVCCIPFKPYWRALSNSARKFRMYFRKSAEFEAFGGNWEPHHSSLAQGWISPPPWLGGSSFYFSPQGVWIWGDNKSFPPRGVKYGGENARSKYIQKRTCAAGENLEDWWVVSSAPQAKILVFLNTEMRFPKGKSMIWGSDFSDFFSPHQILLRFQSFSPLMGGKTLKLSPQTPKIWGDKNDVFSPQSPRIWGEKTCPKGQNPPIWQEKAHPPDLRGADGRFKLCWFCWFWQIADFGKSSTDNASYVCLFCVNDSLFSSSPNQSKSKSPCWRGGYPV